MNKPLNQQILLLRKHQYQEIRNFYNRFGCRGFTDNSQDFPCLKRIKAYYPNTQPMILDSLGTQIDNELVVFDASESTLTGADVESQHRDLAQISYVSALQTVAVLSEATGSSQSSLFLPKFIDILAPLSEYLNLAVYPRIDGNL